MTVPSKPPAFPFYASDYLSSSRVTQMTLEEEGAFVRLLAFNWDDGSIPSDVGKLAKLCKNISTRRMQGLWKNISDAFIPMDGNQDRLVNPKLEKVRAEKLEYAAKQSTNGQLGAEVRWGKKPDNLDSNAIGFAKQRHSTAIDPPMAKNSSPSSSSSSVSDGFAIPLFESSQTLKISRSTKASERASENGDATDPEFLKGIWAPVEQNIRAGMDVDVFAKYWEGIEIKELTGTAVTIAVPEPFVGNYGGNCEAAGQILQIKMGDQQRFNLLRGRKLILCVQKAST